MSSFITIERRNGKFVISTNVYPFLKAALANIPIPEENFDIENQLVTIDPAHSAGEIVKQIEDYLNSTGHTVAKHGGTYPITMQW